MPKRRVLEDALCLVFLEFQFAALAAKSDDEKMINAAPKIVGEDDRSRPRRGVEIKLRRPRKKSHRTRARRLTVKPFSQSRTEPVALRTECIENPF